MEPALIVSWIGERIGANADREQGAPSPASGSELPSKAGMATLMVGCDGHPGNLG